MEEAKSVKTNRTAKLLEKAKTLPQGPGCYLMKNAQDEIIYVGKAIDLKSRVSSYFNKSSKSPKTEVMVGHVVDFDFLLAATEAEAFVLENNLIKKHTPKYNIRMKDDKSYPYVVVSLKEKFPMLQYLRRVKREKDKEVFGPFPTGSNISEVLRILTKSFQLRDCKLSQFKGRKEPCLLFQLHQCTAPCVGKISVENYGKNLNLALDFFRGKGERSLEILSKRMEAAAESEHYEEAAIIRDYHKVLEDFLQVSQQKNAELSSGEKDVDILAFYQAGEGEEIDIALYMIRNHLLLGHKNFFFSMAASINTVEDEMIAYLAQYYSQTHDTLPALVVSPFCGPTQEMFKDVLELIFAEKKQKVKINQPYGPYWGLAKLAGEQAQEYQRVRTNEQKNLHLGLDKLKELLGLRERPRTLECYDVAVWQGRSPTASQVAFHDGMPDKYNYRHYHLETRAEGNNDFAMLKEMMERRLMHGKLPDVMVVDGGKAQVQTLLGVLQDFNIEVPVVGLAKEREEGTEERLIIPGRMNPYILKKNPPLFRLLVQMRDEAHR
ncbi:MAG: excinuclease ABC subunit UvrC, partial [Pseudomonadota bacterium]